MLWLLLIVIFFQNFSSSFAQEEFTLTQSIDYTVNPNGSASVVHQISITNNFSQLYPKIYQFTINGLKPLDIQANDEFGSVLDSVKSSNTDTTISLKFSNAKLGKNQITSFVIRYRLDDLATPKGKTWEISLPQFQNDLNGTTSINIKVPVTFGRLSFSPKNTTVIYDALYSHIRLNKIDPKEKIILIFGNYQLFNFDLKYHIKNPNSVSSLIPIAIPPDTNNQKIIYSQISPLPQKVDNDSDGNWLAYFLIPPSSSLDISVLGQAKIGQGNSASVIQNLSLSEQLYWPVSHPEIKKLANIYTNPKSIYDYVVKTLSYGYDRLDSATRRGALETLSDPSSSVCTDFTDLFITIARAASIPAREIEGFAYSNNTKIKPPSPGVDLLHAWPEYHDQNTEKWIAIDPTWAKTTNGVDYFHDLDLNHFAFVIHNQKSDYPPPPGSYKSSSSQKTVTVNFADTEISQDLNPPLIFIKPKNIFQNEIYIKNINLQSLENLHIVSGPLKLDTNLPFLPPLSQKTITAPSSPLLAVIPFSLTYSPDYQTNLKVNNSSHSIALLGLIILGLITLSIGGIILTRHKTI